MSIRLYIIITKRRNINKEVDLTLEEFFTWEIKKHKVVNIPL